MAKKGVLVLNIPAVSLHKFSKTTILKKLWNLKF